MALNGDTNVAAKSLALELAVEYQRAITIDVPH